MEKFQQGEIVEGDGFTAKPGHFGAGNGLAGVEFKPGESTETARAHEKSERDREQREYAEGEYERTSLFTKEDWMTEFFTRIMPRSGAPYSETLKIKADGSFDTEERVDGLHPEIIGHSDIKDPNGLYALAQEVQRQYPGVVFSFEKDPEGKWMKYTVSKSK